MAVGTAVPRAGDATRPMTKAEKRVIFASSLGTVFEWYDFYLYGSLAAIIGAQFFNVLGPDGKPLYDEATRNIFALLAFAAGFIVRPFGALVFGRIGDLVGRKYTFLVTILLMGVSTFIVGILPSATSIGIAAPIILIILRLLQGLALGGEYGGAATYVAEHAPNGRRGFYTSWIQTTATLGLFLSLIVILATRTITGEEAFREWGWRIPFLVSVVLLGISVWIRLQLSESPAFKKMKEEGQTSKAPLKEAFGEWRNAKIALVALLGLTAGQGVVWYTGQFYALFFLQSILKVDGYTSNLLIAWSLVFGTGFFVFFGWLSDKIGRKPIILAGCAIAAVSYFTIFHHITAIANPNLEKAIQTVKVSVIADPKQCGDLFNPVGTRKFTAPCDLARDFLAKSSVKYTTEAAPTGQPVRIKVNDTEIPVTDGLSSADLGKAANPVLQAAGYPKAGDPGIVKMSNPFDIFRAQTASIIGLLFVLVLFVTMVYGPIAAALVELFPTRIRYSGMSLPYHIGNGWFGGLLPATAFAMVAATGDIYYGLWYPIAIAVMTVLVGLFFVPETKDRDIFADIDGVPPARH
ncbi:MULTISPECIES: MFS transporter [Methylobacterium]|uniref:Sialic acid transporter NanT n=2 Tax=Pseudomonadota TaxID=1224 RepID=A0ABQ4SUZ7_9HYPH|nr:MULTISPECIES: MFS transporter [Methylobacterium]PIU05239.1 MAG: MFS transporter [Methylobacterium sp. CG09_land_8_20_14_0_10_71_15]PIU15490.1 MAG: MFS transporter [Methylobacterium sp. CG08_land_8_20_14_0_20_71_15]GJE06304.1 Sialic acid transporter NanT [Methylobacterium jeotgali]